MNRQDLRSILAKKEHAVAVWYDYFAKETRMKLGEAFIDSILARYPDDFVVATRKDELWGGQENHAGGGVGYRPLEPLLANWNRLDDFVGNIIPDIEAKGINLRKNSLKSLETLSGRYLVGHWWSLYFETLSFLRGPEEACMDILLEQDRVTVLFEALEKYFFTLVDRFADDYKADGIWFGDDYGMQDRMMISPDLFRSFFKPWLGRFVEKVKSRRMDVFMHTCGNVTEIIPDLIEIGVDVLHPIQPGTMDAESIVKTYGDHITFFVGADVQHVVSSGTPRDIRRHVDRLWEVFSPSGGFLLSCGNTIMPETPRENIEALFEAFSSRN